MWQYIRQNYGVNAGEALYCVMDSMYFTNHTLLETADRFHIMGGKHLFLDEVHKYPTCSKEVKEIIDMLQPPQVGDEFDLLYDPARDKLFTLDE